MQAFLFALGGGGSWSPGDGFHSEAANVGGELGGDTPSFAVEGEPVVGEDMLRDSIDCDGFIEYGDRSINGFIGGCVGGQDHSRMIVFHLEDAPCGVVTDGVTGAIDLPARVRCGIAERDVC